MSDKDIPNNAYEQLLAAEMIVKSGDTHVKVLSRTYLSPQPMSAEMLEQFGSTMRNLASTLNHNMSPSQKAKRIERSVFPDDGLPNELVEEYDAFVRERAAQLISDIDDWLASAARRPISNPSQRTKLGVSVYHTSSRRSTNRPRLPSHIWAIDLRVPPKRA